MKRRLFLQRAVASFAASIAALLPRLSMASSSDAFQATSINSVFEDLNLDSPQPSDFIEIKAPNIAEDGATVPIRIVSNIPGTSEILVIIAENPKPLAARFRFNKRAITAVSSRIKMGKTSDLVAVVVADGKRYMAKTEVKVTLSGCGG
jgi:sulfur-oxidizing protein SoxY